MAENLKIALIQTDLYWQDRGANLADLEEKIWAIQQPVDLIILPEMFPTAFTMNVKEMAEPMNFTTTKWMKQMAAQTKAVITGSVIIKEGHRYYNRLLWVTPEGEISNYDKRHLFRMAHEEQYFAMGEKQLFVTLKGWKILPQVCYDLRFPVWARNTCDEEGKGLYDLVFYIASWPAPRIGAWDILLKARAVENLAFCVGVNRVGDDGNGIPHNGHSAAYDYKGQTLAFAEDREEIMVVELDYKALQAYRDKFPAWKDADSFQIHHKQ
ncbi:MAG TPA: amidohydrolase [Cyclobacteriaceae bacterium]|nr:amidohydrolase [Cyclobacteriaceae bacterium]